MDKALTPVSAKLVKLLPRLATEQDGEVVATVRAIGRTLRSAGLDFHVLANALTHFPDPTGTLRYRPEPQTWHEVACWCRAYDQGRLTPKERRFVRDMAAR